MEIPNPSSTRLGLPGCSYGYDGIWQNRIYAFPTDLTKLGRLNAMQDAPTAPPAPISLYGFKRASDDIADLARQLGAKRIILGGHDW